MRIVVIGLSISSSWGNGHAVTYRGLVRELARLGHEVLFLERDAPWYAANRDLPKPGYCELGFYSGLGELVWRYGDEVSRADVVVVGSYVHDGLAVGRWVVGAAGGLAAFYDIDTPVTLAALERGECAYLDRELVGRYGLYLSFTGGGVLRRLEEYGSPMARPLYCSADVGSYWPEECVARWDLGYMGTYSMDRQPVLERLLVGPALAEPGMRFVVAGPQYPVGIVWPGNVERLEHVAPVEHRRFYCSQRFTLNVTRADMVRAGHSPSIRLFEAAACGVPVISDWWPGLDEFFEPGREAFVCGSSEECLRVLRDTGEEERRRVGAAARARVLAGHTAAHRAVEFIGYVLEARAVERPVAARNSGLFQVAQGEGRSGSGSHR